MINKSCCSKNRQRTIKEDNTHQTHKETEPMSPTKLDEYKKSKATIITALRKEKKDAQKK